MVVVPSALGTTTMFFILGLLHLLAAVLIVTLVRKVEAPAAVTG